MSAEDKRRVRKKSPFSGAGLGLGSAAMKYGGKNSRDARALLFVLASASAVAVVYAGCGGTSDTQRGSGGAGGSTSMGPEGPGPSSGGLGGSIGTVNPTASGGSTPGTGGTTTQGTGGSNTGGSTSSTTGLGGFGGASSWPDCTTQPAGSPTKIIPDIWADDPSAPEEVWVPGVYVTAVSGGACVDGTACQIFLQQDAGYGSVEEARQHGIKLFASKKTAMHFTGVAVGDKVNVYGHAWRYTVGGQNELLIQVTLASPGCFAHVSSNNTLSPIPLTQLEDVVSEDYETAGPLFVSVTSNPKSHGKPKMPAETFGIIDNSLDLEAGTDQLISLSPTFLTGSAFNGLSMGTTTHFDTVNGVYGLFVPPNQMPPATKYKEIYVRSDADYPHTP